MSNDISVQILLRLISKIPPQEILVHLAMAKGMTAAKVLERFSSMPLGEILRCLERDFAADPRLREHALRYTGWFKGLHGQMGAIFDEMRHARPRRRFTPFFARPNGRVELEELLKNRADPVATLIVWSRQVETIILIANVLAGITGAMEQLISHEPWVRGYMAVRIEDGGDLDRIVNHAWNRIYKKLHTFDPATASFRRFSLIWVAYAIGNSIGQVSRPPVIADPQPSQQGPDETGSEPANDKTAKLHPHCSRELLADYLEQHLPEEQQMEIEEHLADCETCVAEARSLRPANERWQKTGTG